MRGYYSVFNPRGEKIADCGIERDAVTLIHSRNSRWDGHYYTFIPLPGDIVDVSPGKQLPTRDIVVNMNGGVGGSWSVGEELNQVVDTGSIQLEPGIGGAVDFTT